MSSISNLNSSSLMHSLVCLPGLLCYSNKIMLAALGDIIQEEHLKKVDWSLQEADKKGGDKAPSFDFKGNSFAKELEDALDVSLELVVTLQTLLSRSIAALLHAPCVA